MFPQNFGFFIEILFFSLKIMFCFLLNGLSLIFKFKDYPLTFPLSPMQLVLQILLQYRHIFYDLRRNVQHFYSYTF